MLVHKTHERLFFFFWGVKIAIRMLSEFVLEVK